jgi:hypothetical protein
VTASALVVGTATAESAVAISTWGSPNMCTHSSSLGVGWAGTKTATYVSGYWAYWGSVLYHFHSVYVEYTPINNASHPSSGVVKVTCAA